MTDRELRTAYHAHKDAVYRFAWRMTGSGPAAEDIAQETFLALLLNPDRFDPDRAPLRAFLLAVARNLARKQWRGERRWSPLEEETYVALPLDPSSGETSRLVAEAVQSLPPLQREVLVLAEYEDMPLDEIAHAVDAELGTVKARLHRARQNLRRMLAPLATHNQKRLNTQWNR
ncbi:MAG: RNA polymerase sigma factor [Bryobacterales bacterium]|nr:RNA polymerase sigma factor [Bryobacterales bacterium]